MSRKHEISKSTKKILDSMPAECSAIMEGTGLKRERKKEKEFFELCEENRRKLLTKVICPYATRS